ncbi:uncharacterized protein B0I36DRAFT_49363 [Microdochium trichocladiopsis]|uniref:Rhodopsin domain-containing protein n=1 Tax=Microdochium trichocladiopsis TaxID=1682393 RepID=A0A9P8XS02_9PEZI|nr:uncharacterized protein B0I36DRAFT_49363 [Microdochium trichocladiopsis]KAH7014332.1 hypothetical protein B0I36DRAFT_49363 [Microdochium trichocladiopsis]
MSPLELANMPVTLTPRWATPSHTPFIDTTLWTLTSVAVIFLALRLWTRINANRTLFADDWLLIAATVLLLGHAPLICWYTRVLFDEDIDLRLYSYLAETNVMLYSLTQALSKTSIAVVLTRCTFGWWKWTTWALTGLVCAMLLPHAILGFAIICDQNPLYAQWAIPGPCIEYPKLKNFKIAIQVVSIIIDVWFTLLPWKIVWKLKLKTTERFGFAFAMSLGTGTCVVGIYRLYQWLNLSTLDPKDVTFTLWNFTEPAVTVIAACLPVLRVPALAFIRKLKGQHSTAAGGTSHSQHPHNGYIKSMSRRQSGEWPLRESSGASQRSLGDIVVKQDFVLQTESMDLEDLKGVKATYKPC